MTLWSKFKTGLRHPRRALMYLALGPQMYHLVMTGRMGRMAISEAELRAINEARKAERNVKPENPLETHMLKPTNIHEHLATLHMLTVELNLRTAVELGVARGESTIALLEAAKQIGGRVYSIDITPCLDAKARVQSYGLQEYWAFIQGDDLKVEWNKSIDHLFIDAHHTFDQTMRELQKYEPYVRNGGIVTMHDIVSFPEVLQAIKSYIKGRTDLRLYKYFNNSGLAVIFKGHKH